MRFPFFILVGLMLAACGSANRKKRAPSSGQLFQPSVEWLGDLKAEDYLSARVCLEDSTGKSLGEVSDFSFVPFMTSMGHGSFMADQTLLQESNGCFLVEKIWFTMGGPWDLRISATIDDKHDTVVVVVEVP